MDTQCNFWERLHCLVYTQPCPGHAELWWRVFWEGQNCRESQTSAIQDVSSNLIWLSSAIFRTNTSSVPALRNILPVNQTQGILHRDIAVLLPSTQPQSSLTASHAWITNQTAGVCSDHRMGKRKESPWWSNAEPLAVQAAVSYNTFTDQFPTRNQNTVVTTCSHERLCCRQWVVCNFSDSA